MTNETDHLLIIGGSDAGISAGLKAKELQPDLEVTILLADDYPNLSICGLPYAVGREVADWHALAHRDLAELTSTGIKFQMSTVADRIDPAKHEVQAHSRTDGEHKVYQYTKLVVATGAQPKLLGITGVSLATTQQPASKVSVLHTMADYFALERDLDADKVQHVAVIGAGYIGIEMAEALRHRHMNVTIFQRGAEVLSTVDADLGQLLRQKLVANGVTVLTKTAVTAIEATATTATVIGADKQAYHFDLVLIVVGVQPNTKLLVQAGAETGIAGAIKVDEHMQTSLPDIWAAGDLVETKHRLLGTTYLPLGTTAHKQGRIAGYNLAGVTRTFKGSVGTQVLKAFDLIIARTGLLAKEAAQAGFVPLTTTVDVDDHKAYYPGAQKIKIRITGDRNTGQLLGAQLVGHFGSEVAKRNDVFAAAIFNKMKVAEVCDLDLSYSPPVGSPWDAVQLAAQDWEQQQRQLLK
ncbi:FAD-dependent oxidoreductase [Loigolactobacillus jiayinensis]|uniref:FAD-dependent oxidoreductase n=1 Tax=Loigolactobacillus jiayinensis TaxID=2486016 RepID=A0ABW1RE88_9LACO|nr:FAD-dependent oxidoreductase [Loigolactobacillus jiayinensis]